MIRKINVYFMLALVAVSLIVGIAYMFYPTKDSEQVAFIRDFVENLGESEDGRWLAIDKLFDKNIINDLSDFSWNYTQTLKIIKASEVQKIDDKEISKCLSYLTKTYQTNDIETYRIVIKRNSCSDNTQSGDIIDYINDTVYLIKKDGKYRLLYTQSLFDTLKSK